MKDKRHFVKVATALMLGVLISAVAVAEQRLVTTSASGEVESLPDIAVVSGSVQVEAKTAREATKQAQRRLQKVIEFIRDQGVDNRDLNAASVRVHPKWHYPRNKPRQVVGYQASAPFKVKLREMEKLGELYAGLPEAGASDLNDTGFDFSNREQLELEAIAKASQNARERARAAVKALGEDLGEVANIQVNTRWHQPPMPRMYMAAKMDAEMAEAPQLNPGNHKISASVTVSFTID